MDVLIDKRFERVEKALATLLSSISTYNPNPAQASDLVTADTELSQGFEQLYTHQSNYAKILALRATSSDLDTQIRDTLTLLANTRRDLIATPASTFPTNTHPVSNAELLSYARRISKFTLPTTQSDASGEAGTNTPKEPQSQAQTNGTTTPVVATNGASVGQSQTASTSAMDVDPSTASQAQKSDTTGVGANAKVWEPYFDTSNETAFLPWPNEETIRRGALASIQILVDKGVDPWTFDPEKSAELEADRQRIMEEEDRAREVEQARMDEERRRAMERRMSSGEEQSRPREQPKVFQLETFDDDEDSS